MSAGKPFSYPEYIFVTLFAVLFTWELHEFTHWLTGTLLGNEMRMGLNTAYPASGFYTGKNDALLVSAAGPLFTMIQALLFYFLLKKSSGLLLFPFLFTCFYMRLLATGMSFINPNDEARISHDLGWGTFTLPLIVTAFLFFLVFKIVKTKKIKASTVTITTLLVMLFSSAIILIDQSV